MAPGRFSDANASTSNFGDRSNQDANAQDQILLKALQEFLVPLVQMVVDPAGIKATYFNRPEAMKLITALKDFVSAVVGGTVQEVQKHIKIEWDAKEEDNGKGNSLFSVRHSSKDRTPIPATLEEPDLPFQKKLLSSLREHVSNKMPIRLLRIEPRESYLKISLLDKGEIYAHLKETMLEKMHETEFHRSRKASGSLETEDEAIERVISKYAGYAILSHKWLRGTPGEITYNHWNKGLMDAKNAGYEKLANFCRTAWKDYRITLGWMDTICINKDSSSELDESIRSMYAWYERANVCIVHLSETKAIPEISRDSWFTRGWTLQELLAPKILKFYSSDWKRLVVGEENDKSALSSCIKEATTISSTNLMYSSDASLSCRMQWAAFRKVTREEDMAYSLMGIFDVSISIAYGEGAERAFYRLLEEIIRSTPEGALDLFNWAGSHSLFRNTSILPSNPRHYLHRSIEVSLDDIIPIEPLILSPMGVRTPVILMPGTSINTHDSKPTFLGSYGAIASFGLLPDSHLTPLPTAYSLLDKRVSGPDGYPQGESARWHKPWAQLTFAVFNIVNWHLTPGIFLPQTCIAVVLKCNQHAGQVTGAGKKYMIQTAKPVVFRLEADPTRVQVHKPLYGEGFVIPVDELAQHGMQLVNMYL
ncbi:hypothetical protein BDN70DRAFT_990736 [Pholiota conissans]|uniref:Heterokaryon incompatibility domain-containing protein n=1 Tax=Pholiota conissans TaxID=109636 RepID=A0A9P5ZBK6_9AGAR|nr:hypothetical protein BDN70DRAFT_990736 [Pholiota conissans]